MAKKRDADDTVVSCVVCKAKYRPEEWRRLPFVGLMTIGGGRLELRQCGCGNTLGVSQPPSDEKSGED